MLYRAEMVATVWKFIWGINSLLVLIPGQCLHLTAGEETGCCKTIAEKEVGGPLWLTDPFGTVGLRLLHDLLPGDDKIFQIMFEEMIIPF